MLNFIILNFVQDIMVAGGMESLSNVPFIIKRDALKLGNATIYVSIVIPHTISHF